MDRGLKVDNGGRPLASGDYSDKRHELSNLSFLGLCVERVMKYNWLLERFY